MRDWEHFYYCNILGNKLIVITNLLKHIRNWSKSIFKALLKTNILVNLKHLPWTIDRTHWSLHDGTEEKPTLLCARVYILCFDSKRIKASLRALLFFLSCDANISLLQLALIWTPCLLHWTSTSTFPYSLHAIHKHKHTLMEAQLGRDVTCVPFSFLFLPRGALNNISGCFCSPSILSHPVVPRSFYEHLLMQSFLLHLGLLLFHYARWLD